MRQAREGDTVKVHYTASLEGGVVFDASKDCETVTFTIGKGEVLPGFEKHVIGMKTGEKKTTLLPPEDAFGKKHRGVTLDLRKSDLPEDITLFIGQEVQCRKSNGKPINLFVTDIYDAVVTFDENHPLAGKSIILDVELVEIT